MKLLPLLLAAATLALAAPAAEIKIERYKTGDWEDDIGYRQAVRTGNTLYISGCVGSGAMPNAIRESYDTLAKVLQAHGLTFQDVVKETLYTTDLEAVKANLAVRRAYYGKDFPAATWVQVARLYDPGHVLEVELVAVFSPK
jgi:enamine deaminase RidA (YjgF/YER057c/UK114 family)